MEKIKLGIVGLNFGKNIVEQLRTGKGNEYFQISAICDLDYEKAERLANEIGAKAYGDLGQLLSDPDISAIGLFTGPAGRADLIRRIIKAGKDVMTTKPFELRAEEALSVLKEAQSENRIVHLNSPSPLLPADIVQIKQWEKEYHLGRQIACRSDVWVSYREKADGSWYDDAERCPAAPVFRLGIYPINDMVRIFGKADKVQVMHSRIFTGRPTPDNAQMGVLFKNGVLANVFASFCVDDGQAYKNSLIINYENGTIYRDCGPKAENEAAGVKMTVKTSEKVESTLIQGGRSGDYQWEVFYRAISGEKFCDQVTPEEVAEGIKIMNAMSRAEKSGCMELV